MAEPIKDPKTVSAIQHIADRALPIIEESTRYLLVIGDEDHFNWWSSNVTDALGMAEFARLRATAHINRINSEEEED